MATISKVFSAELDGIEAKLIEVETDVNVGLHSFTIVGLADKALSEAKERVNAALKNAGLKPPSRENRRIVVNLAPADVKKAGSQYDAAIAVGYLLASEQVKPFDASRTLFLGELSLDGKLRRVSGVLSIARLAHRLKFRELLVPQANAAEAALVRGVRVVPIPDLGALIAHLEDRAPIAPQPETAIAGSPAAPLLDVDDVRGQGAAKRALAIAAAGGHNLLMSGSPGTGKTMLAQALTSLLPPLERDELIEVTQIYSAAGILGGDPFVRSRPFRAPHHSASAAAVLGGGSNPRPGEITLAHRGVLFLDEFPEFHRDVLEALRQPLESGRVHIARARGSLHLPAKFTLVAAMNPCPCGYYGDAERACECPAHAIVRYQRKLSGPLLDRIDLQVYVPRVPVADLRATRTGDGEGEALRRTITAARGRQRERLRGVRGALTNADLTSKQCDAMIRLTTDAESFLKRALEKSFISARGYYRLLKTAQTIADLEAADAVDKGHLEEAFGYRIREA